MTELILKDLGPADLAQVAALNEANAAATSPLDQAELEALIEAACYARGAGSPLLAFLVAMDQDAPYQSVNFQWFKARYDRFVYIDRIVTAEQARGRGLGKALYADLFAFASENGHERVCCEVNLMPPNVASDAFHKTFGFDEIGRADIHSGAKTVRYLEKIL